MKQLIFDLSKNDIRTNIIETYLYGMNTKTYNIIDKILLLSKEKEEHSFYALLKDYLGPFDLFSHFYYTTIFTELLKRKKHTLDDVYELIDNCTYNI